jgi:hypothetical protein
MGTVVPPAKRSTRLKGKREFQSAGLADRVAIMALTQAASAKFLTQGRAVLV